MTAASPTPQPEAGHDLSNKPPVEVTADIVALRGNVPDSGCLLIGDGGKVFSPDDYGTNFFVKLKDDQKFLHYTEHPAHGAISGAHPAQPLRQTRRKQCFCPCTGMARCREGKQAGDLLLAF